MANYFQWDCDSTTVQNPSQVGTLLINTIIDTSEKRFGTASMRVFHPGNAQGSQGLSVGTVLELGSWYSGNWLFWRCWMKFASNFLWGPNADPGIKWARVKQADEASPLPLTLMLRPGRIQFDPDAPCLNYSETNTAQVGPRVFYNFDPATNAAVKDWQEYILGYKRQSAKSRADGELRLWVNGILKSSSSYIIGCDQTLAAAKDSWGGNALQFPQLNGGAGDGGFIWYDEMSLDDQWNSKFWLPTNMVGNAR